MNNRNRPEYRVWSGMHTRCTNENEPCYKYYGGRGITVCERWRIFSNFFLDMGERPKGLTLGRIDNEKGYFTENCRWEDLKSQARNKRNNRFLDYNGDVKTLAEWCEIRNLDHSLVLNRLKYKWTVAQALGFEEKKWDRSHKRVMFEYDGIEKSLPEWAKQFGIKRSTLSQRIYTYGWDLKTALTKEVSS